MKCRTLETRATTAESRVEKAKDHVEHLEMWKSILTTRAEGAEKALGNMEVKCRMLETRATTAECRFEEAKNALKSSVDCFAKRYLENLDEEEDRPLKKQKTIYGEEKTHTDRTIVYQYVLICNGDWEVVKISKLFRTRTEMQEDFVKWFSANTKLIDFPFEKLMVGSVDDMQKAFHEAISMYCCWVGTLKFSELELPEN